MPVAIAKPALPEVSPRDQINQIITECCRGELHENAARDHMLFVLRSNPGVVKESIDDLIFRLKSDKNVAVFRNAVRGHILYLVNTLHLIGDFAGVLFENDTFKLTKGKTEYHFFYKPTSFHATLYRDGREVHCAIGSTLDFLEMSVDCSESLLPED